MADREKVIKAMEYCIKSEDCRGCIYWEEIGLHEGCPLNLDALALLNEPEEMVHPEPSCELTYITDCCCDLCGVQLIRGDNFCRGCGKQIVWEGSVK